MMSPTNKETLSHLFENILELDKDNIKLVGISGYKKFSVVKNSSYETRITLRDKDIITTSLWQELSDFRIYINAIDPDYKTVICMTATSWEQVTLTCSG